MTTTDMAVVVSQAQNEVADMAEKGLDIVPHRQRMVHEDMETKFKDSDDPFRLVFVCAMWMTGFDVPSCSTIYLDKPMRNHTLMQTIARANRVFAGQGQRADRRLRRRLPRPAAGAGHLRLRRRRRDRAGRDAGQDKAELVETAARGAGRGAARSGRARRE